VGGNRLLAGSRVRVVFDEIDPYISPGMPADRFRHVQKSLPVSVVHGPYMAMIFGSFKHGQLRSVPLN
jgi:hypothetical protein